MADFLPNFFPTSLIFEESTSTLNLHILAKSRL